jgi:hypothetical protein
MAKSYRRFEILLPTKFNDGSPVPDELIGETLLELRKQFGAVSSESQTIAGSWSHEGQVYRDDLVRVFVDVQDDVKATEFFRRFKEQLKQRFQQIEIWITSFSIDVI